MIAADTAGARGKIGKSRISMFGFRLPRIKATECRRWHEALLGYRYR